MESTKSTTYFIVLLLAASIGLFERTSSALIGEHEQQQHSMGHKQVSVQTSSGILNGAKQVLNIGQNSSIYKFLAVPYAEPPTGAFRFRRPIEVRPERGRLVIDASKFGKTCPQYRHLTSFISPLLNIDSDHQISEDCLHLNVFVPSSIGSLDAGNKLEPNKQLPVIVWIPGEGFDFADARQFDGSYLAHKTQSIVVTVQYRVGILGFLQEPKMNITGNMGIYDQIMALRWVKKNIAGFGGDSERVTLMGRFSGSMSISTMITAPNRSLVKLDGQPLFNRVALLSGVAVNDWIINSKQAERVDQIEQAALAKSYCSKQEIQDFTCLQNMPIEQLLKISDFGWRLVIDNELIGQTGPIEAVEANQLMSQLEGVLIGETGMEGTLCLYRHMLNTHRSDFAQLIDEDKLTTSDLYDMIRDDSLTYFGYNLTKSNPIQAALESMANMSPSGKSLRLRAKYLDACSSYMVKSHSERLKRNIMAANHFTDNRLDSSRKQVEVFHYELRYKPSFSLAPDYIESAAHGDDIPLIFGLIYGQPRQTVNESDLLMTRKMMSYIGNFVHGNSPLLRQHASIEVASAKSSSSQSDIMLENETVSSMDENETPNDSNRSSQTSSGNLIKRSWSSEGQVDAIDFNENDFDEINTRQQAIKSNNRSQSDAKIVPVAQSSDAKLEPGRVYSKASERANVRVILVESPKQHQLSNELRLQSIIDLIQQVEEPLAANQQDGAIITTKSQRLLELHRQSTTSQQQLHPQPQVASSMTLVGESSFMTMFLFSSCIVIFALMSVCLGLCLVIFRNNLYASKKIQHFTSSSSSCNICDESQGSSIDAVLNANKKDARGFSNVFAKLRSHANGAQMARNGAQVTQCTSTANKQQHRPQTDLVLNQRDEINGASH